MTRLSGLIMVMSLTVAAGSAAAFPSHDTPSDSGQAKASFDEGYRHQKAERFAEAIDAYERSLKHDRRQAEALSNMGFCYKSLKRYGRAISAYKDALDINPDLAEAHEYLGEAYVELGKLPLAEREYKTLLKLDPDEAGELKEKIEARRTVN